LLSIFNHSLRIETSRFMAEWKGFLFTAGCDSGEKSVLKFLAEAETENMEQIAFRLKGQYAMSIFDKLTNDQFVFTDEGGHFHVFYGQDKIHQSLLTLLRELNLNKDELDPFAVSEFFHWGTLHFNRTFFSSIKKLEGKFIWKKQNEKKPELLIKPQSSISDLAHENDFGRQMEVLCDAIRNRKVSADLTGGIDSRLIVSYLLHFDVPFDTAVSGNSNHEDVMIAGRISKLIGKKLLHTDHNGLVTDDELREIFFLSDGMMNVLNYHRIASLQRARKNEGYDLALTGSGGEIYKEFSWLTDFPFYNKKYTNLDRYYRLRFRPTDPRLDYMTEYFSTITSQLKEKILTEWKNEFLMPVNSQTYDHLYYRYKWPIVYGRYATNSAESVPIYAPLLELDSAKFGFHLPRNKRIFNHFHREQISRLTPQLARLPGTESSMTVSDKFNDRSLDLIKYSVNRAKRLLNKSGQRIFNRTWLASPSPNHPAFLMNVRELSYFKRAVEILKEAKILSVNIREEKIQDAYVGRIISLAMMIEFLDQK